MAFVAEGFTKQYCDNSRSELRAQYPEVFDLADRCGAHAATITAILDKSKNRRQLIVSLFFCRCMSHYQAACMLAECSMTVESLSLSRNLMETVFVMLAIVEDAVTFEELVGHDRATRVKHANAIMHSSYPEVDSYKDILATFLAESKGLSAIDIREFARRGNALAAYDGIYRHLSHHAAHPSLSSVDDFISRTPTGGLYADFRPLKEKALAASLSASAGILLACSACDKAGIGTAASKAAFDTLWKKYTEIYAVHNPWPESPQAGC